MFDLHIKGDTAAAWVLARACQSIGLDSITINPVPDVHHDNPAGVLTPNLTKVVHAVGLHEGLASIGHQPDRAQVRFGRSAYLLSELPLGKFCAERYGAGLFNVDHVEFMHLLRADITNDAEGNPDAPTMESTTPPVDGQPNYILHHSRLPRIDSTANANITWLNPGAMIWQFSTNQFTHFYILSRGKNKLAEENWHTSLHEPISMAVPISTGPHSPPRDNWYEGNVAFAGRAAYPCPNQWREHTYLGLEDAWVLSRMLENYEEDWSDAFSNYEQFRRARARRVSRNLTQTLSSFLQSSSFKRLGRNLNIAMSTRFLPEIAMQRIDWHYGHDCIRGFR